MILMIHQISEILWIKVRVSSLSNKPLQGFKDFDTQTLSRSHTFTAVTSHQGEIWGREESDVWVENLKGGIFLETKVSVGFGVLEILYWREDNQNVHIHIPRARSHARRRSRLQYSHSYVAAVPTSSVVPVHARKDIQPHPCPHHDY